MSDEAVKMMIQEADLNKNGQIDLEELKRERLLVLLKTAGMCRSSCFGDICSKMCQDLQLAEYEQALQISDKGYEVIYKRDIDELMINNYNPEWFKAWDANMDMQVCLDYYAVIVYITDYYMKDETGTIDFIKGALKNDESGSLKQQMNLVKNTFLTHRQAGECEIYYKLFKFLHLSDSNITSFFIPTGFRENMSRYLKNISAHESNFKDNVIEVEGKEGKFYVEIQNFYEKYLSRHEKVACMNYVQFAQRYTPYNKDDINDIDWNDEFYGYQKNLDSPDDDDDDDDDSDNNVDDESSDDGGGFGVQCKGALKKKQHHRQKTESQMTAEDFIFEYPPPKKRKRLPHFIPLHSVDGKMSYMKLRAKRVIRFHKFSNTKTPHEFYFTEMQKYLPFVDEEELFPGDIAKCKNLYESKLNEINFLKSQILPHLESVTTGREKAEQFASDIGDILDANKELEDDIAQDEGEHEIPEMAVKDPASSGALNVEQPSSKSNNGAYRRIEVQDDKELYEKVRHLDPEQRFVIDKAMAFARQFVRADNQVGKNDWPSPPQMVVLGNGGTGKSHVIDILSQLLQKTFSRSGDDPDHPYILRLAFTGNAALLIKGQTLNSVFNLPFGNDMNSLMDKIRDMRRTTLQNLRLIIIDEISLVKSDMLYQIHFRLSREIKQNNLPFGNLGLICFGDILQIKPPSGQHVFDPPKGEKNYMEYLISPLWQNLSPIILKTNHRQGEDKEYAEICNRARIGELTKDDMDNIKSHIFSKNSPELPNNAIFSTGTNSITTNYNIKTVDTKILEPNEI